MITPALLCTLCPKTKASVLEQYIDPLNDITEYYEINTPLRLAGFLSQIAHESAGFTAVKENLNYSYSGLLSTFKKYFSTEEMAKQYQRNPEKIANRIYANRMNNGDESSGDGYKYCGRGVIQITGKYNYTKFATALEMSLEDTAAFMETAEGAISSAGWYWDSNSLNDYCDRHDWVGLCKRINGGVIGIAERQHLCNIMLSALGE
jgi:putative chitinase